MSLFVDINYLTFKISHLLRNFQKKASYLYVCACPICGDSQKSKLKARGYFLKGEKDGLYYKCHNCGISLSFGHLLEQLDKEIYSQYVVDSYLEDSLFKVPSENNGTTVKKKKEPEPFKKKKDYGSVKFELLVGYVSLTDLSDTHPAKIFVKERKIPEKFWRELYWTDDFLSFVDKFIPQHSYSLRSGDGRILIPCLDRTGTTIFAVHGRTISETNKLRYITVKASEDSPKTYGLHNLSKNSWQRVYVTEGAFDSMFLPNGIALGGGDIPASLPVDKTVIVYDNEPYKPTTVKKLEKVIRQGRTVCIFPDSIKEKDINEMILKEGIKPEKIRSIVDQNLYSGMQAEFRLLEWRKDKSKKKKNVQ